MKVLDQQGSCTTVGSIIVSPVNLVHAVAETKNNNLPAEDDCVHRLKRVDLGCEFHGVISNGKVTVAWRVSVIGISTWSGKKFSI